jgi:sugar phosphate isomerase/epimerase
MIKLGFSTIGCPEYDLDQVIALAKDHGFEGVELRFLQGTTDLPSLPSFSKSGLIETRQKFDDAGIEVVSIGTGIRMNSFDPKVRAKQLEDTRVHTDIAVALGANYLRVFGGPIPPEQDLDQTLDAIATGLGEVADLSMQSGVTSLLETHDAFCKSPDVLNLYERGASENLAVLWDTLHSYRHGEDAETTWKNLRDRIKLAHVKDAFVATPTGFDFALTGQGSIPIMTFFDVLRNADFDRFVNFEWEKGWHPEIEEPDVAIPHFARYMAEHC